MFKYKLNVMDALKNAGYSSYRLGTKGENLFGQATLQKFRTAEKLPSWEELGKLCRLLGCSPWDIVEYIPDVSEE